MPKQRNTKEENEAIKAGKTAEGWEQQPAKNAQKDKDARWTKKNDESFYGYKPPRRGQGAQADPQMGCNRCGRAR